MRDPDRAERTIGALADLLKRHNGIRVRIVGYTDEAGGLARNTQLSLDRANRVRELLATRGVAADRLIAVGRANGPSLAPASGPTSPNRRVEFEVAFSEETADGG